MDNHQLINQTSNNVEWYTPWKIIECARELMGGIDLDPFSCEKANERPEGQLAKNFYFKNGLTNAWGGNLWINHPWGRDMNSRVVERVCREYMSRNRTMIQACMITFASTSEGWFRPLMDYPQFFFTGRTNYLDSTTMRPVKGVPKGSVITYFPPKGMLWETAIHKLERTFGQEFEGKAK